MANRDEIIRYANEYLELYKFEDFGPQGLQYPGRYEVDKIACAVSVSAQVIDAARFKNADMLIVHHGLFWDNEPRTLDVRMHKRLERLEQYDLSLVAYHLALDAHPIVGNNIMALQALGATKNVRPFARGVGWGGELDLDDGIGFQFYKRAYEAYGSKENRLHYFAYGPKKFNKVAVVTGKGGNYIHEAKAEGYELLLTGEPEEWMRGLSQDLGIHVIAAGHHATERAGVQELTKLLCQVFECEYVYIDIENPV